MAMFEVEGDVRPYKEGPTRQAVNRQGVSQHTNQQHQELAQLIAADWRREIVREYDLDDHDGAGPTVTAVHHGPSSGGNLPTGTQRLVGGQW